MQHWQVELDARAVKELQQLGSAHQKAVLRYLRERIATPENPRRFGKGLLHEKRGLWRYRVQDVRVICSIQECVQLVVVLRVGLRKEIY